MGRRVVLVDADLGGANLHTCLGLPPPSQTLADFIQRRASSIEEVVTETPAPGLRLISGAADLLSAANIKHLQKVRVMKQVRALDVDVVLIDLGAGTSYNIIDFFLLSDVSILAVVPEPTSIENGYRFIKSALYRRLRAAAPTEGIRHLVESALDPKNPYGIRTPLDLLARVEADDPESARALRREVAAFQPRFVVNEVRDVSDVAIGHQLVAACSRHLGLRASYSGFVHHDDAVWQAVRRRQLFMSDAPTSRAAEEIRQLTRSLVKGENLGSGY
jgi:flagellar biosynthesis protein FlhG